MSTEPDPQLPRLQPQGPDLSLLLPTPVSKLGVQAVNAAYNRNYKDGTLHLLFEKWAKEYGQNFCLPTLIVPDLMDPGLTIPHVVWIAILTEPEAVEQALHSNLVKGRNYGFTAFSNSILGTRDLELWRVQRQHFSPLLLPEEALAGEVFQKVLWRARQAPVPADGRLELSSFFTTEAISHLRIALFGEEKSHVDATNPELLRQLGESMAFDRLPEAIARRRAAAQWLHDWARSLLAACPVGPVGAAFASNCPHSQAGLDTIAMFAFAGHDTTANLLAWALFELCRTPSYQQRAYEESAALARAVQAAGRDLVLADLQQLPFLGRVLTETLRYWPSIPNGSWRELSSEIAATGLAGQPVSLPAGSLVQTPIWNLHVSPELWGPTADVFDPDREFAPEEVWFGRAFALFSPESRRYKPFSASPRDCIGRNFAQMEARLVLHTLLLRYEFVLAEPTLGQAPHFRARSAEHFGAWNGGTMRARFGLHVHARPRTARL